MTTDVVNKIYVGVPELDAEYESQMKSSFPNSMEKVDF